MNPTHDDPPPQPGQPQPMPQGPAAPPGPGPSGLPGPGAVPDVAQGQPGPAGQPGQTAPGQPGQVPQAPQGQQVPQYPADQAFAPGGGLPWAHISRRYTWHRRVSAALWAVPIGAVGAFLVSRSGGTLGAILWLVAVLLSVGLVWIVAELAYRAWGYAERGDDLIVTYGVFVKRLIVVPYGRMQFVDVTAGLLEQWMGIATVRMHTAAAATDAMIPGLPAAEAALLRDRLAQKGEERSMGL